MSARRRGPLARNLPPELQVAATNGSIVTDSRGRKYIDFVMGWCVGNFGWRPAPIAEAVDRFKGPDYVYPGYSYAPWTELARLLASLAPRPLTTCLAQRAARVDRRIDSAAAAVSDDRQADRRERAGHAGAFDMMRGAAAAGNAIGEGGPLR